MQSRRRVEQNSAKGSTIRTNKATGTQVNQSLRLRIDPRNRNRGSALQKDSYKANDKFMKKNLRVNNVTESKIKWNN